MDSFPFSDFNSDDANTFLRGHPEAALALQEALPIIRECFGSDVRITLEVFRDPEACNVPDHLAAYIRTNLPADEALERLDRFDNEWILHPASFGADICFDLEFV